MGTIVVMYAHGYVSKDISSLINVAEKEKNQFNIENFNVA